MKLTKSDKEKLYNEYKKVWHDNDRMVDWCVKNVSGYIDIDGVIVVFDKPHIKTDFWFGEHTYDYDEVCNRCAKARESVDYFIAENMRGFDWKIEQLEDHCKYKTYIVPKAYYCQDDDCRLGYVELCHFYSNPSGEKAREMTADEKEKYTEFIKEERAKFEKRLNTYLKRYGLSKCSYGVFWADR